MPRKEGAEPSAEARLAYLLEKVDIRPLKALARKHFPTGSKFRMVVEAEPDFIPRCDVIGKILPWDLLMTSELDER